MKTSTVFWTGLRRRAGSACRPAARSATTGSPTTGAMRLSSGPKHGAFWLPEDGDQVICAFLNGQLKNPVIVGSIYKGIVRNIEPGLNAMFVDIGLEKNAFLHFWDAIPEALDSGLEEIQRGGSKGQKHVPPGEQRGLGRCHGCDTTRVQGPRRHRLGRMG